MQPALTQAAADDPSRAIELAESAFAPCLLPGERHREAALHNNLADLLYESGHAEAEMASPKEAAATSAEIDEQDGSWQPWT